jgi:hypothetical protein
MKFKPVAIAVVAAALSAAVVSPAAASPLSHPKKPKPPAAAPQITGSRLAAGLLPAADFGTGFTSGGVNSSGGKLLASRVSTTPAKMSCENFEDANFNAGLGETAWAVGIDSSLSAFTATPRGTSIYDQSVVQFASAKVAAAFQGDARTKFAACGSFSAANPPGGSGGTVTISTHSVSKTTVDGYPAVSVSQSITESTEAGAPLYQNILFVNAGTDVYKIWDWSGSSGEVSPAVMTTLINRVRKLY